MSTDTEQQPITLLDLADVRFEALRDRHEAASSTLDAVMQRIMEGRDGEKLTVSAFGSSL